MANDNLFIFNIKGYEIMIMDVNFTYVFCNSFDDSWKDSSEFIFLDSTKKLEAQCVSTMLISFDQFKFVHCYEHKKTIKNKMVHFENVVDRNLGFDTKSNYNDLMSWKCKKYSSFCFPPEEIEKWI